MAGKIIVCVTAQRAVVTPFRNGRQMSCSDFPVDGTGPRAFGELLRAYPGLPVYVMVDSVEEDYHTEILPHVAGHARQELLQRKLRQVYRNTSYCAAWLQGRESDKRRDDRYLFAALTNAEMLRPWLDELNALQAPLAGVYLLPMVSQELLSRIGVAETDLLLVSRHNDGLRQSFFRGNQLRASRFASIDPSGGKDDAAHLAAEVGKTRLYLSSLRLMSRDGRLTVLLLDTHDLMAELQLHLQQDASLSCHRLSHAELAARMGCELEHCHYALHMAMLGLRAPAHNLAPAGITRQFWQYRQRRRLAGVSAVAAAVALLWTGANLFQQFRLHEETRRLDTQTREQQARYAEVVRTFPQAPASAEDLEMAVRLAAAIRRDGRAPERAMLAVSRALARSPEITLTRLSWKFGAEAREGEPTAGAVRQETGLVEGEVRPFHGDYRAAMASINRLADSLRQDRDVAGVNVVQMPLNIHSATVLRGNTLDAAHAETARAEFKLKLVFREPA